MYLNNNLSHLFPNIILWKHEKITYPSICSDKIPSKYKTKAKNILILTKN